jgi:hypothetical protein
MTTRSELLALHDQQVRGTIAARLPSNWTPSWDGPALEITTPTQGFVFARDLDAFDGDALDALIARVRDRFAARAQPVEWKTYSHDRPDLPDRLRAAGFTPDDPETVVIGEASTLTTVGDPPADVTVRSTTDLADLHRIAAMESEVWNQDWSWMAEDLQTRIETAPQNIVILLAEAADRLVSAAWLVIMPGTEFAALWGGSTLASWRRRGIYRALVARRAQIATTLGIKYLQVDASKDSAPILQRLGLQSVTTTTPFIWRPPS